jgi:hypothetical protein
MHRWAAGVQTRHQGKPRMAGETLDAGNSGARNGLQNSHADTVSAS